LTVAIERHLTEWWGSIRAANINPEFSKLKT